MPWNALEAQLNDCYFTMALQKQTVKEQIRQLRTNNKVKSKGKLLPSPPQTSVVGVPGGWASFLVHP